MKNYVKLADLVVERKNKFLEELETIREPILVYGAGVWGQFVASVLEKRNLKCQIVCSKEYIYMTPALQSVEDALENADEKFDIIIAHNGYDEKRLVPYMDKIHRVIYGYDCGCGNYFVDNEYMTYEWFLRYSQRLQNVYDALQDDISKETMVAYINQRISVKCGYISKVRSYSPQYFEDDIIKMSENEVFVDCGAYDGNTAVEFIKQLKSQNIKHYDSIVSFEPNKVVYERLRARNLQNHICLCKGTSDKKEFVNFSTDGLEGAGSAVDNNGSLTIENDTIDDVLDGGKATYIKMDIEGSELVSLKGAANTIRNYKPKLAICLYHKKNDLFEIPEYIHSLVPEYKFYLRVYKDTTCDLILYAMIK